ncbi:MAG: hypothetical protein Q4E78_06170 [Eubacteriales bacterium]|nr:hypothetical protein [Eubacteriales bacterium]
MGIVKRDNAFHAAFSSFRDIYLGENGYSVVNDFMVYDEPSASGLYIYYPYVEEKKKGVNYLDDMYIRGNFARDEELQGEARPDGTSSKAGNSACDSMIVNVWSTPEFALKYNSISSNGVGDERVGFAFLCHKVHL